MYTALFAGIGALLHLLIVVPKNKTPVAAEGPPPTSRLLLRNKRIYMKKPPGKGGLFMSFLRCLRCGQDLDNGIVPLVLVLIQVFQGKAKIAELSVAAPV